MLQRQEYCQDAMTLRIVTAIANWWVLELSEQFF